MLKLRTTHQPKRSGGDGGGGGYKAGTSKPKHHSGRNSRNKRGKGGYSGRSNSGSGSKGSPRRGGGSKDADGKSDEKSKKGGPLSFSDLWNMGFLSDAVTAVADSGLDISLAIEVATANTSGRISACMLNWNVITDDAWVLDVASNGYSLSFQNGPPRTPYIGRNPPSDEEAKAILDKEAAAIIEKGAAVIVDHSANEVISGFFARPKKEAGKWRPIVNLKFLNRHLRKVKFSMTTVADIRNSIQQGHYFVSIDLTDAYYSVPLNESAWPYVRFAWGGKIYEYHVLVFGLAPSPRVFTKMATAAVKFLKAVFLIWLAGYIDDFLIQADSAEKCRLHAEICILVFHCLGYEVNFKKSVLIPSTQIEHLGFIFDSMSMTISLPGQKISKIVALSVSFLASGGLSVDELHSLVGRLESVRPAVELAPLHYRALQLLLRPFLRKDCGKVFIPLSQGARLDLQWWAQLTVSRSTAPLKRGSPLVQMSADASGLAGWGGHSSRGQFCKGA